MYNISYFYLTLRLIYIGFCRDEAEMEYLKMVQDLDMHGVDYFQIRVTCHGLYRRFFGVFFYQRRGLISEFFFKTKFGYFFVC